MGINLDRHHVGLHWCVRTVQIVLIARHGEVLPLAIKKKKKHKNRFAANGPQHHTLPANAASEL